MLPMMKWSSILVGATAFLLSACSPKTDPAPGPGEAAAAPEERTVSFTKDIKPILANKCTICHNTATLPKRPSFETREKAMRSGMIVPGHPEASRIFTLIEEEPFADMAMPPVGHRLTKKEIGLLKTWITEGAYWPEGKKGLVVPAFIPEE